MGKFCLFDFSGQPRGLDARASFCTT